MPKEFYIIIVVVGVIAIGLGWIAWYIWRKIRRKDWEK
jgi:hypothetical protein